MKLSAITVCYNYSDYLKTSIRANAAFFDEWLIVTHSNDTKTIDLCNRYAVRCCVNDNFIVDVPEPWTFNKGKAINHALSRVTQKDWILMLDADTCLPYWFRRALDRTRLNIEYIYAMNRVHTPNWHSFNQILRKYSSQSVLTYHPTEPDLRVVSGYFQLFHWDSPAFAERERRYVEWPPLGPEDRLFSNVWRKTSWKTDPNGPLDKGLARRFSNIVALDIGASNQVDHHKRTSPQRDLPEYLMILDENKPLRNYLLSVLTIILIPYFHAKDFILRGWYYIRRRLRQF